LWEFSNGFVGPNNDSVWFTPPSRAGYFVDLRISDIFPQTIRMTCKVRVSQIPSFFGTGPIDDTICVNELGVLLGGTNDSDTVGVSFPEGNFEIGGSFAGLTPLPDGSGVNYSTSINMSGFPDGSTFQNAGDLQSICVNMEHSFLGDLEMWLECPDGTQVTLFNSYSPGAIPGGFSGGGTFLGDANDNGNGTPGIGFDYCFSTVNATFGTMAAEFGAGNTIPVNSFPPATGNAMNPNGVYLPETDFSAFNGCPLNGNWTVYIRDNLSIDDGYIFEWGLYFDGSLFPDNESYLNTVDTAYWLDDPTIVSGQGDTLITVLPTGPGEHFYTFAVEDDFGCYYDTTVRIVVKDSILLDMPASICNLEFTSTLNVGTDDGVWTFYDSDGTVTFEENDVNTTMNFSDYGVYNLVYSDTSCTDADTVQIIVDEPPYFNFDSDFFVCDGGTEFLYIADSSNIVSFEWSLDGQVIGTNNSINLPAGGVYSASYENSLGCGRDTSFTISTQPPIVLANYPLVCNDTLVMVSNSGLNTGVWSVEGNPNVNIDFETNDINTTVYINDYIGTLGLIYSEDVCNDADTTYVQFSRYPWTQIFDSLLCSGEIYVMEAVAGTQNTSYTWNTGESGPAISVTEEGTYIVTVENVCGIYSDEAFVQFIVCDLDVPNVFTPNGDGANDFFELKEFQGLADFSIVIFNRWGNVVQEYNAANFQWDGRDKSGTELGEGVYFYRVETVTINGREIERHGFVQLVRE
jgi:gliding motility-associated-like protein